MKQFSNLKRAFLPCLFVLLTLPAWGQMQPVTKNFRKTPLKNVLKEVEAQTGLSIMYDTRELNLERPVTASFDRTPVSQVLREVLDRTVQYSIIPNANTIIINQAQNFGLSDLHQMRAFFRVLNSS